MTEPPTTVKVTSSVRVAFALVGALLLLIGLYPLNSLVKAGFANQFETTKQRIVGIWQQAHLHTLPQLEQRLASPQRLQELAAGELSNLERDMEAYRHVEPRLQQVFWLRTQGQAPLSLFTGGQTDNALLNHQQKNIQKALDLPRGHSLLDLAQGAKRSAKGIAKNSADVVLIHHLRPVEGQALGALLFVFDDADSQAQISTVLPVNDPMTLELIDGNGELALQVGAEKASQINTNKTAILENGLRFSLTQGATYQQTLAPIQSPVIGIHSLPSWRLVMHLPAKVIAATYIKHVLPMALALLALISMLWWMIFRGFWGRAATHKTLPREMGEAIFPDKIYPWSFRTGQVQSLHANTFLLSLGYDITRADTNYRAFLNTLASEEDIERLTDLGSDVLEGRSEGFDVDLRLRHRRGYWVWYNILGRAAEIDKQGGVHRIDGVCIEITRRKQDEQASVNALQNTRHRHQIHYQFIADISQRMQANVQSALAQRGTFMGDKVGAQTLQRAHQHLLHQINQTLAYSKISLEQDKPTEQRICIATLMEETLASVDQTFLLPECKITSTLDTGLAESYWFDGEQLVLLINLLFQTVAFEGHIDRISIVVENRGRTKRHDTLGFSMHASGDDDFHKAIKALLLAHTSTTSLAPGNRNINITLAEKMAQRLNTSLETALHPSEMTFSFNVEMPVFEEGINLNHDDSSESEVTADVMINTPPPTMPVQTSAIRRPDSANLPYQPESKYEAIDPDAAKVRMDGQEKILCRVYQRFLLDFEDWQKTLEELVNEKSWAKAKVHAHTLKGSSSNIDAVRLSTLAAQLEALLKQTNIDESDAQHLMHLLAQENDLVRREIQQYLTGQQNDEQVAPTLDLDKLVAILDDFKYKLSLGKRLPADDLNAVKHTLINSAHAQVFDEFVRASHSFEFDKAASLLQVIRSQYQNPKGARQSNG